MKINKFWLNNFRTIKGYYEVPISNDSSLNLITAEQNGAGKTSIFFAFYFLVIDYVNGKTKDEYINWDSDDMSCGIDFDFENRNFKIECSLSRGKSLEKTLSIDGEEFSGSTAVNKKLKEYFDPSLFLNSTALFQGSKNFTSIKDSERRDNLKKVFNIDYKDEVKNLDVEDKDLDEKQIKPLEKELIILKAKTFKIEDVKPFGIVNESNVDSYKKQIADNEELISSIRVLLASIDSKKQIKLSKEKELERKRTNINQYETTKKNIEESISTIEAYKEDTSTIESYEKELEKEKVKRIRVFNEQTLLDKRDEKSKNESATSVLKKKQQDCKSGICPVCGKEFSSHDMSDINTEIENLNSIHKDIVLQIEDLEKEKKEYENTIQENKRIEHTHDILKEKIEAEKKRLADKIVFNQKELASYQNQLESLNKNIESINNEICELETEIKNIIIEDEENKNQELANLLGTNSSLLSKVHEYENIVAVNNEIVRQNEQANKDRIKTETDIKDKQKAMDELVLKKDQFKKMKDFLRKEFPAYVISSMIQQIQDDMNDFISKVYYKDLDVEIKEDDDSISVKYGTGKVKIDTVNASGAEEGLLALSYCFALNKLKEYNILLIDEVDAAFTEDNSRKLAEIINSSKEIYDFIMVVSHVKATKDFYAVENANIINVDEK